MERDIRLAKTGDVNDLVYKTLVGLKLDLSTVEKPEILEIQPSESGSESSGLSEDQSDNEETKFVDSSRPRSETIEEKKARKKAVKDAQAEKRKAKIRKHIKKRKEKLKKK